MSAAICQLRKCLAPAALAWIALMSSAQAAPSVAAKRCSDAFRVFHRRSSSEAHEVFSRFSSIPPAWQQLVDRGLLDRYWQDPRVEEISLNLATAPDGREFMTIIDDFKVKMEVHRSQDQLVVLIPSIRVQGTELGGRAAGIDGGFIRLLSGVLRGVDIEMAQNPAIRSVRVEANKIVNQDLIRMLESLGFDRFEKSLLPDYKVELQLLPKNRASSE
jgi:hypothetical protein